MMLRVQAFKLDGGAGYAAFEDRVPRLVRRRLVRRRLVRQACASGLCVRLGLPGSIVCPRLLEPSIFANSLHQHAAHVLFGSQNSD